MSDNLIKHLSTVECDICRSAAAEIERLREENLDQYSVIERAAQDEIKLRREVERLRTTLSDLDELKRRIEQLEQALQCVAFGKPIALDEQGNLKPAETLTAGPISNAPRCHPYAYWTARAESPTAGTAIAVCSVCGRPATG